MTHQHFIIYKPYGYLSQFVNNQNKRRNKKLLGDLYPLPEACMAIGRLDEKSEGLLMLTTDGKVSEQIRSNTIEKEYWVMVDGIISQSHCEILSKGVEISTDLGSYVTRPCKSYPIPNPKIYLKDLSEIQNTVKPHGCVWLLLKANLGRYVK